MFHYFFLLFIFPILSQQISYSGTNWILSNVYWNSSLTNTTLTQLTYNSETYDLVSSIEYSSQFQDVTSVGFFEFEDPVDDITYRTNGNDGFTDWQSIGSKKVYLMLEMAKNGTYRYKWSSSLSHIFSNSSSVVVHTQRYPETTDCPSDGTCVSYEQNNSLGGYDFPTGVCLSGCAYKLCQSGGLNWQGGDCLPIIEDGSIEDVITKYNVWFVEIEEPGNDAWLLRLVWQEYATSYDASYPDIWKQKYFKNTADTSIDYNNMTCGASTLRGSGSWFWHNFYRTDARVPQRGSPLAEIRAISYSLKNWTITSQPYVLFKGTTNERSYIGDITTQFTTAMTSFASEMSSKRVIITDPGVFNDQNGIYSNSSLWLFLDESIFGEQCYQINVNNWNWYNGGCERAVGSCMNATLREWETSGYGLQTTSIYSHLKSTLAMNEQAYVSSTPAIHSEDNIQVTFVLGTDIVTDVTIPSSLISYKEPNICSSSYSVSAVSDGVWRGTATFTNCGTLSYDFYIQLTCADSTTLSSSTTTVSTSTEETLQLDITCGSVTEIAIKCTKLSLWSFTCSETQDFTGFPTETPTETPTEGPTETPTGTPTETPSESPSIQPSKSPTQDPTESPSESPTEDPTESPSQQPSMTPSESPSVDPTTDPTSSPTGIPTKTPSMSPSTNPTKSPSQPPSRSPSRVPSMAPTAAPSSEPTVPSAAPTSAPTEAPTLAPTPFPSISAHAGGYPTLSPTEVECFDVSGISVTGTTLIHDDFCVKPRRGNFVLDSNTGTAYFVNRTSQSRNASQLHTITVDSSAGSYQLSSDSDSQISQTLQNNLIGASLILLDSWVDARTLVNEIDVENIDLSATVAVESYLSLRFEVANYTDLSNDQITSLKTNLLTGLYELSDLDDSQDSEVFSIDQLRQGSVVSDIVIQATDDLNSAEIKRLVLNSIATQSTSSSSSQSSSSLSERISDPFGSVDAYYIDGSTVDIIFTYCPGLVEKYISPNQDTTTVSYTIPTAVSCDNSSVTITLVSDDKIQPGDSVEQGSYLIRYSAEADGLGTEYCSFTILVVEKRRSFLDAISWGPIAVIAGSIIFGTGVVFVIYKVYSAWCSRSNSNENQLGQNQNKPFSVVPSTPSNVSMTNSASPHVSVNVSAFAQQQDQAVLGGEEGEAPQMRTDGILQKTIVKSNAPRLSDEGNKRTDEEGTGLFDAVEGEEEVYTY